MVYGEYENPPTVHIFMDSVPPYTSFSLFSLSGLPMTTSDIYFQTSISFPVVWHPVQQECKMLVDIFITMSGRGKMYIQRESNNCVLLMIALKNETRISIRLKAPFHLAE